MYIKFYDPRGNFTYKKELKDVDPNSKPVKDHFWFGGYAVVGDDRVASHNTIATLLAAQGCNQGEKVKFDVKNMDIANDIRRQIQGRTATIDDGESVSITVWFSFIQDHAHHTGLDPNKLAVEQLQALIEGSPFTIAREH